MHKDYWVAIFLYAVAVGLVALPFFGLVTIETGVAYLTLKYLHIVSVIVVVSCLFGQMIAFFVMQRADAINDETIRLLSFLDYVTPVGLIVIAFLGYAMASQLGALWEHPWVYESAFGVLCYAVISLVITAIFRRKRFFLEDATRNPLGVYVAGAAGLLIYGIIAALMVLRTPGLGTARIFVGVTQYFSGM